MTPEERWKRWEEIDRELEELWAGKVCDDPVAREGELLEEQDALEFEEGMEYFKARNRDRRRVEILSPGGIKIDTLKDWEKHAPPRMKKHWKKLCSAMECARSWLRDGTMMPEELFLLLESRRETRGYWYERAFAENIIMLDESTGGHRNSDVTVHGSRGPRKILLDIEAKANERFGNRTIAQAMQKGMQTDGSYLPTRIMTLVRAVFGRDLDEQIGSLRYQLLYSFAAPVIEASRTGAGICALIVHEFESSITERRCQTTNAADLQNFVSMIPQWSDCTIEPGKLLPPIKLPGAGWVRDDIPVTIGKIRTVLGEK